MCVLLSTNWTRCKEASAGEGGTYLGVTDEFHSTSLVGSEAGDLADNRADHLDALALTTLTVRGTRSKHSALGLVTTVHAPDETYMSIKIRSPNKCVVSICCSCCTFESNGRVWRSSISVATACTGQYVESAALGRE